MKKVISLIFVISIIIPMISIKFNVKALSEEDIKAPSAILIESTTGKVLFEKNADEIRACASITKVMTLLLIMEALDEGKIKYDDIVTSSAHAASMGGSDIWLEEGEQMSVYDMIKATVVASANDAAVALAEFICGTEDEFVRKMNEKGQQLGMTNTVFKNCNGLDEEGHVTSARDVAIMSAELTKHEKIFEFTSIWMDYLRDGKTQIVNTNKLLKTYKGITGLKTGTTSQAGSCFSASAERDGLKLVAVVLGCGTTTDRFDSTKNLLDFGFANYKTICFETPKDLEKTLKVKKGLQKEVKINCEISDSIVSDKEAKNSIRYEINYNESIEAPIKKNQKLGEIIFYNGKDKIKVYDIVSDEDIEEITIISIFKILFYRLCAI